MKEIIDLIDMIIEEHKTFLQKFQTLDKVANDVEGIAGLEKAKDVFMPGRHDFKQGLQKLQEIADTIDAGLRAHFGREETALLSAFNQYGDEKQVTAFNSLLLEHKDLKNRLVVLKNDIAQLTSGGQSGSIWQASAHDMRAHISHTRKLLQAHAQIEQELFRTLRNELTGAGKK
ncbi:MAG: hemerythrin domain-containing protein [Chloroflexota bacterium]